MEIKQRLRLRRALDDIKFSNGKRYYELAAQCHMKASKLSRILAGVEDPTPEQAEALCALTQLGRRELLS